MTLKGFTRAGHFPTLIAALLYFDVSFMTWVMLGPLAPFLREDLGLSSTQQALGLFGCAGVFVAGTVVLLELGARWSLRWDLQAVRQAGRRLFIPDRIIRRRYRARSMMPPRLWIFCILHFAFSIS